MLKIILVFFFIFSAKAYADIKSSTGNIVFDVNSDNQGDVTISSGGLGIGTAPSSNLHVSGNAAISDGNMGIGLSATNSTLEFNGSLGFSTESLSSNTTLSGNSIVLVDSSSDNITLNLPYAGNVNGREYSIKKLSNSNKVYVSGGGNSIDTSGSLELTSSNDGYPYLKVFSDGTQWYIVSKSDGISTIGSDNLVGWWKFDENSGNVASDSSSLSHSGNLSDGLSFSGNGTTGPVNRALNLDGDVHMTMDTVPLGVDHTVSISLWVNPNSLGTSYYTFVSFGGYVAGGYLLQRHGDGGTKELRFAYNGSNTFDGPAFTTTGSWFHVVATAEGTDINFYVNGSKTIGTRVNGSGSFSATDSKIVEIGRRTDTQSQYTDAKFDDVRIYNKVLSNEEVQALYQQGL